MSSLQALGKIFAVGFLVLISESVVGQTVHKLTASDAAAKDFFGISVSINDDVAIVGSFRNDDHGLD